MSMNVYLKEFITKACAFIPDEIFLHFFFLYSNKKRLNLKNPKTYSEKIQWLKVNDHNPEYARIVDKFLFKKYIEEKIGPGYTIPLLGVWDNIDDIDFESLPDMFVLKCTHDSGGIVICKDKSKLDIDEAKKILNRCLHHDFYLQGREWPYKNVVRRIIAEEYVEDESGQLIDYKVFTFNGEPKLIQVDYDRFQGHKRQYFTTDWNRVMVTDHVQTDNSKVIACPKQLDEMMELSRTLSTGFHHVRVDFFIANGKVYVGEMTFHPASGAYLWKPESFDEEMGKLLDLSKVKIDRRK